MRLEVDVQPLASGGAGFLGRRADKASADAAMPTVRIDGGVEDEGVAPAVPADLNKPDEKLAL